MRLRQWTKNLFLFAGLVFTDNWRLLPIATAAFAAYCLMSSGVYLLNDVRDREHDRLHPEKRLRPIACGVVSAATASSVGAVLCLAGLAVSFAISVTSGAVAVGFLVLQAIYTLALKHLVLLDVFGIAAAFVMRVIAGAVAIGVPSSEWLLVCTLQLALFMAFGKRRHELVQLAERAGAHRGSLDHYSVAFLDQLISIVLGSLIVSYAVYSASSPTAASHPGMVGTLPFVIYGIFRYLYLIHIRQMGGSPETILLKDRPLQVALLTWFLVVVAAFRFG
jgi:4-hydroxybenzoate polyprenyltransferase